MIRLMGLCFLAAAMTMVLRQMNMAAAGLLCTAFGVLVLGMMLPDIQEYVRQICKFLESMALEAQYGEIMLRAVGIVLLTQFSAQICRDYCRSDTVSVSARRLHSKQRQDKNSCRRLPADPFHPDGRPRSQRPLLLPALYILHECCGSVCTEIPEKERSRQAAS